MMAGVADVIREIEAWNESRVVNSTSPSTAHDSSSKQVGAFEYFSAFTEEAEHTPNRTDDTGYNGGEDTGSNSTGSNTGNTPYYCMECKSDTRTEDGGHLVCTNCGDIGLSLVDDTPEWRYYGQDDSKNGGDPSRCGVSSNYLMPESSIGTIISTRYGESYRMRQARQYHSWNVMDYRGRNLYRIFDKLQTQSQKYGINYIIIEHAKQLYKTISSHQLFRGQNKEGLIADCVYRACKDKGVPRSIKEISIIFGLSESVMTKGNRCFSSVWNRIQSEGTVPLPSQSNKPLHLSKPSDYIERFCSPLRLQSNVLCDCVAVARYVETNRLVPDNTAPSIAAAVIYYVVSKYQLDVSKEDIAKASKKSEVTIGKCYKKLLQYDGHLKICMCSHAN